jgi:hypothetical protein
MEKIVVVEAVLVLFALVGLVIAILECRAERRTLRTLMDEVRGALATLAARTSPTPSPAPAAGGMPGSASGVRPSAPAQEPGHARVAVGGLSTPFRPSPAQVEAARVEHEKDLVRARWEAAEDDRERERAARKAALNEAALRAAAAGSVVAEDERRTIEIPPPPASAEHEDSDAGAQVFLASDRPTVLGGIAPRAHVASPTLISAGIVPRPGSTATRDPVEARYLALCETARRAGLAVDHCNDRRADCHDGDDAAGACFCSCDGCARATAYVVQAEREVMGPPQADTPKGGRE